MKKQTKIIIGILIPVLIVIGILGGIALNNHETKNRQIEFLKAHETEITEYVKQTESEKVSTVEYDWDTVNVGTGMAFTPESLSVHVRIYDQNHKKINGFSLAITSDDIREPHKITAIDNNPLNQQS
jgi:hypothetical protein